MKSHCAEMGGRWYACVVAVVAASALVAASCDHHCPKCVNFGPPEPAAKLTTTSLTFGNQAETTTSAAEPVGLSNVGSAALSIGSITTTGDFAQTDDCGPTLDVGQGCTINVTFSPTALGTRTGEVLIAGNDPKGNEVVKLSGTGTAAPLATTAKAGRLFVASLASNDVTVIDRSDWHVVAKVAVGKNPAGLVLGPDGTRLYVTNYGDGTASVVDTASARVVATIRVGENPSGIAATADGAAVWVVNSGSNTAQRINARSNTVESTVRTGAKPRGVAVSPDGAWVYVTNSGEESVSKISAATSEVVATIAVGRTPMQAAVTPDGGYVYVANADEATVTVIDAAKDAVASTLEVGTNPVAVAMSREGDEAFVVNENFLRGAGSVTMLDTRRIARVATWAAGGSPLGAAVSADGGIMYVVNSQDGTVMEVDARTGVVHGTHGVGLAPVAVAVAEAVEH